MSGRSLTRALTGLVRRDLTLALRRRAETLNPVLFYAVIVSVFTLGLEAERSLLQAIGPGVVWRGAVLAALLSLEGMFRTDFQDGTLEQMVLSGMPLPALVLAKVLAHWLVTGLPLVVAAPVLGSMMALPAQANWTLAATLALGTPVLSVVGAVGVALTLGLARGGMVLALLVLPLYVPLVVVGTETVRVVAAGGDPTSQYLALAGLLLAAMAAAPAAVAAGLRVSLT